MMASEKPGGHGERCVAVGTLDMALWDATAKIAGVPLYRHLADRLGEKEMTWPQVAVYAGGGYYYPTDDMGRLSDEIRSIRDLGYHRVKIKIGGAPLLQDLKRIDAAARILPDAGHLAVDAIYSYTPTNSIEAADALAPLGLWWFEDICDPLDFETLAAVASRYAGPIAAGEALFSAVEAKLLDRYAGLRCDRDILLFDPVHCYGLPGYLEIIEVLEAVTGAPQAGIAVEELGLRRREQSFSRCNRTRVARGDRAEGFEIERVTNVLKPPEPQGRERVGRLDAAGRRIGIYRVDGDVTGVGQYPCRGLNPL